MYNFIMVRYGDLILKGKNQREFRELLNNQMKFKLAILNVSLDIQHDLVYIKLNDTDPKEVIDILNTIPGISSYSKVVKIQYDLDLIAKKAIEMIQEYLIGRTVTFKVETKRADKNIPLKSLEISQKISGAVLSQIKNLDVDVHHPELTLYIEVRKDSTYLYLNKIPGIGGFPVSIGGKAMVLMSGGIDSPVSGYLMMKKGLEIECVHFESTPMTSIESAQKVIDLVEVLAKYSPNLKMKLHMVPFYNIHQKILENTPDHYVITIMRRMMYRIASLLAKANDCKALVSGDSIGQVASQTLDSMQVIQSVTDLLTFRPLSTFDKNEIINIAKSIGTLDISNRPFSDCCTIYVPKRPKINPRVEKAELFENNYDYASLLKETIKDTKTLSLNNKKHLDVQSKGLIVSECI